MSITNQSSYSCFEAIPYYFKNASRSSLLKTISLIALVAIAVGGGASLLSFSLLLQSHLVVPLVYTCAIGSGVLAAIAIPPLLLFKINLNEIAFKKYKEEHYPCPILESKILLVLESAKDWNGAFQEDSRSKFRELEKEYTIVYRILNSPDKILSTVIEVSNQVPLSDVWVRGHGTPTIINGRREY